MLIQQERHTDDRVQWRALAIALVDAIGLLVPRMDDHRKIRVLRTDDRWNECLLLQGLRQVRHKDDQQPLQLQRVLQQGQAQAQARQRESRAAQRWEEAGALIDQVEQGVHAWEQQARQLRAKKGARDEEQWEQQQALERVEVCFLLERERGSSDAKVEALPQQALIRLVQEAQAVHV